MAPHPTRRLPPPDIAANRSALVALQALHDYTPINPAFRAAALAELHAAMEHAQQQEIHAQNMLAAARDAAHAAEWTLHQAVLGAKTQVMAQYGPDSDAVQALGLKKKSDRKRPARRRVSAE